MSRASRRRRRVNAGEEESAPTIEVDATPTDPAATGHLDQAPVNVSITTESVENALAVPIDALLALAGGGYAVEVAEGRVHRLEAVSLGLFDDADGLVQVSGQGLSAGQRVVVPGDIMSCSMTSEPRRPSMPSLRNPAGRSRARSRRRPCWSCAR